MSLPRKVIHLTTKGQIVLPKKMRAHFGLLDGGLVSCELTPEGILVRAVALTPVKPKKP